MGSSIRGPVDFTGYWALVKHEGMDEFLKAAGFPWVVRKAAAKFGGSAVDLIAHSGTSMRVTSLNAKGSWARTYDTERDVSQRNAEGTLCKTSSWWEGRVFRSRMEGSELGVLESWRYIRGNSMAVRTALRLPPRAAAAGGGGAAAGANGSSTAGGLAGGQEAVMFWFFDRMETLQRHVARGRVSGTLLQQIESDQRHVERATRKDTRYIQDVLLDWQRWRSPADDFIHLASPPALTRPVHRRRRSPGSMSPASMSKSPSNDSLTALPAGVEARSIRSDSRSRLAESELSTAALDRMARQAAALALAPPDASPDSTSPPRQASATAAAGAGAPPSPPSHMREREQAPPAAQQQRGQQQAGKPGDGGPQQGELGAAGAAPPAPAAPAAAAPAAPAAVAAAAAGVPAGQQREVEADGEEKNYAREATLTYPRQGDEIPVERRPPLPAAGGSGGGAGAVAAAVGQSGSLTFRPSAGCAARLQEPAELDASSTKDLLQAAMTPGPGSDAATRGSVHGSITSGGGVGGASGLLPAPAHQRTGSAGSMAGAQRSSVHYKSMSADSTARGGSTPGRTSPRVTPGAHPPVSPSEQIMAVRLHEFGDARGIAAVVPVATPNDTAEPQLLSMSPEQAEETAAKLRELEADMMLRRQENRRGWSCCGCFVVTLASDTLPDHLRVWESRLT